MYLRITALLVDTVSISKAYKHKRGRNLMNVKQDFRSIQRSPTLENDHKVLQLLKGEIFDLLVGH